MKKIMFIVFIFFSVCLSGCVSKQPDAAFGYSTNQESSISSAEQKINDYLQTLCSEAFAGRMPGTAGNDLAQDWLVERLEVLGIKPYEDDVYKMRYMGRSNTFGRSEMTISFDDNKTKSLTQGEDFFISLGVGNFSVVIEKDSPQYRILEAGGETGSEAGDPSDIFIVFENKGYFSNSTSSVSTNVIYRNKTVQLSDEIYGMLRDGDFKSVEIINEVNYSSKELYNIVGRIKGTDSANCVVLSAHFDHVGAGGAAYFPGALDNASGTSALLYIAESLKIKSETLPFDFDIVIAFFNSEEYFFVRDDECTVGSRDFVSIVTEDYENIYNINIDCVGKNDGETYGTGNSGSESLSGAFSSFAAEYGIICDNDIIKPGDNISFLDADIPSFYFNSADWFGDSYHTNLDTPDKLSVSQIVLLSDMIVDFLATPGNSVYKPDERTQDSEAPLYTPAPAAMVSRFSKAVSMSRAGIEVSYFEEFYHYYPEEVRTYYSYSEWLEIDERLEKLHDIGDYSLRIVMGNPYRNNESFIYFNTQNQNQYDLWINPVTREDQLLQYSLKDIPGLDGYSVLTIKDTDYIVGFYVTKNDASFIVFTMHITSSSTMPSLVSIGAIDENTLVSFIQTLGFDEFLDEWRMYSEP